MIRVFPAHNVDSLRAYVTVGITRSCVAGISSSPILIEVGFFSSPTLLCVQVFDMLTARQRQRYVLTRAACGRVSWSSWPAPIVTFLLISDVPVAGRYSAFFSSSPRLGRRLRLRLRLRLVRLVALLEGSSFSLGLRRLTKICDDSRMGAAIVFVCLFFLGIIVIIGIPGILFVHVFLFMHIFVLRCCIGGSQSSPTACADNVCL